MRKNNLVRTITALCAALVLMCSVSVTAFAQTPADETNDSGVITEPQPLTPEGNMELIDDIQGEAAGDKQFIVVKSRGGNYFYIVIDHAAKGENTVHFLNQVDEADLMAIIGDGEKQTSPAVCTCTEKCEAGKINTACPVCSVNRDSCTGKAAAEPQQPEEQAKAKNSMGGLVIFLILALLGGGGALYYFKFMKPKQSAKGGTDLEDFDFEDYDEDEPEEETDDTEDTGSDGETEDEEV